MTRTTATSTYSVPVIAGWICSKCGTPNTSEGSVVISSVKTVSGTSSYARETASAAARKHADAIWRDQALGLILESNKWRPYYDGRISIKECNCVNCQKREFWSFSNLEKPVQICCIILPIALFLFSLIDLFDIGTPAIRALIGIAVGIALLVVGFNAEKFYEEKFSSIPPDSVPQLITLNKEVLEYADSIGVGVLNESRAKNVYLGLAYKKKRKEEKETVNTPVAQKIKEPENNTTVKQSSETVKQPSEKKEKESFCYNCGKPIRDNSKFCSYCGTKLSD